ncbi:hypothetical protein M8C21_032259 [Ambrosia artemisiifolia]|uniref:Gibberellin regulated protein n=1 Tax=Ambrosia artemisiifolia TaxID=4212 RepID=A0AAD5GBS9_AMBAR|nr:hypothetical protein M8C21_032259 [Ambrosia artemisiifolia]
MENGVMRFVDKWKSGLSTFEEISEFRDLMEMVSKCKLSEAKDSWRWDSGNNNEFFVKRVKQSLCKDRDLSREFDTVWTGWIPLKAGGEGSLSVEECPSACSDRCFATHHPGECIDVCQDCCGKCLCVPSGTFGNKDECPCYRDMLTKYGEPKCP